MNKQLGAKSEFLERWLLAVDEAGIPRKAYDPDVSLLIDESGKSPYKAGAIFNPHRFKRPFKTDKPKGCPMCCELEASETSLSKDLMPKVSDNFLVTYNAFPHIIGSSIALARNKKGRELPMYDTANLLGLEAELEEVFRIASVARLKVFHNNHGAGASIPGHEHWHLLDFIPAHDQVGTTHGFDAAEKIPVKGVQDVKIMPHFPFTHAIFDPSDPDRIVDFLNKLQSRYGESYQNGHVPHSIIQGEDGILVTPNNQYRDGCIGSSDIAGHYLGARSREEFKSFNLQAYFRAIGEVLINKDDFNLESLL